jgi:hypothetical protein
VLADGFENTMPNQQADYSVGVDTIKVDQIIGSAVRSPDIICDDAVKLSCKVALFDLHSLASINAGPALTKEYQ